MNPYYESKDGRAVIHHGDCLDVMRSMPDGCVDAVVTDPPYIVGAISVGTENAKSGTWADMENAAYWFAEVYRECFRILKPTGSLWTCLNWRSLPTVIRAASLIRRPVTSLVVWDKDWIGPAGPAALRPCYEMMALIAGETFTLPNRSERDIWRHPWSAHKPSGHAAEKPIDLMRHAIRASGVVADAVIFDPFLGSGTTLVAALQEGCRAIGIEREAQYVEIAKARVAHEAAQGNLFNGASS